MIDAGPKKIDVIKVVREFTGMGLVEAKRVVGDGGGRIVEGIPYEQAVELINALRQVGATAAYDTSDYED